jgi:hypothetical protein
MLFLDDYAATVGEGQRGLNLEIRLVGVALCVENREFVDAVLLKVEGIDGN